MHLCSRKKHHLFEGLPRQSSAVVWVSVKCVAFGFVREDLSAVKLVHMYQHVYTCFFCIYVCECLCTTPSTHARICMYICTQSSTKKDTKNVSVNVTVTMIMDVIVAVTVNVTLNLTLIVTVTGMPFTTMQAQPDSAPLGFCKKL